MTLAEAILAAMTVLPCPADEPRAECQPWRANVAQAVADVSEEATCSGEWAMPSCVPLYRGAPDELAATLVEVAMHESGLRRRIQAWECRGLECDAVKHRKSGRVVRRLARSMWQLHASPTIPGVKADVPRDVWLASTGTTHEAIVTAARAATRLLVHAPQAFGLGGKGPRSKAAWRILASIRKAGP